MKNIRNFCIIAHIDHGKSTLASQLLKYTKNNFKKRILDNMDLEIEKGITIKNHIIQLNYIYNKRKYLLNLIDTPGHADFTYEVYKSILACEGAILLIDISKNIQAQTIHNLRYALKKKIKIIPVLNKIDLKINYENVINDVKKLINCKEKDILLISAKKGYGIKRLIINIIKKIPYPKGNKNAPLQAYIIDSYYDKYKGIYIYIRIFNGQIKKKNKLKLLSNNKKIIVNNLGKFNNNNKKKITKISAGDVGYLLYKTKKIEDIIIGDTIININDNTTKSLYKIKKIKPNIFISLYPTNNKDYNNLKKALIKLKLNDYSFNFFKESSKTLGFGFRCGFLGILHFEIIKERINREYKINIIISIPHVTYKIFLKNKKVIKINNPIDYPNKNEIVYIKEPLAKVTIISYNEYIGKIITYCIKKRGVLINQKYTKLNKVKLIFNIPYNEFINNFNNKIKVLTKGFNLINYNLIGYKKSNIVKVDIYINKFFIDGFSFLTHEKFAYIKAKKICNKLKKLIPKKQFEIPIQASINNKIIVRENIKSFRKDVTSKCYGGDISRKMKLLNKQKIGKKKMKKIGNIELPESLFLSLINIDY
ncbi:MAG: translation elongation factor 4 [Candidatus Shikimatogenerans bostrichidophilus]|nr:MAG: translation elongation factor 4 [Candidatus Shikimatogenerans bostrichidophilus]